MKSKKKNSAENSLKDFIDALDEIQRIKGIDKEELICAVEAALISAYKKDYKGGQNVKVEIDRETGVMTVFTLKTVVEDVENPLEQISLSDAQAINSEYGLDDIVEIEIDPKDFGRVAAQNAKQLILQRIKEAERNMIFDTYFEKKDELVTGTVQRVEKSDVYVNLGKTEGIMNYLNQIPSEHYYPGMRIKVYITDVIKTNKGPQIFLSRSHPGLIKRLFEFEIPEIYDGSIEIMSISREAGNRTKIAVLSKEEGVDAVGACVGHKGTRIQNILTEIGDERIDVVEYNEDPEVYIKNALNPATAKIVKTNEEERTALVVVDDSQLSLAIGKDGQNVRLAAKLSGWKIDIKNEEQYAEMLDELLEEESSEEIADEEELNLFDESALEDDQIIDDFEGLEEEAESSSEETVAEEEVLEKQDEEESEE